MPAKLNLTYDEIYAAMEKSDGILIRAALLLKANRSTVATYISEFTDEQRETIAKMRKGFQDEILDYAVGTLYDKVRNGDPDFTKFFLKTRGGYSESHDHKMELSGNARIVISIPDNSRGDCDAVTGKG